MTRRRRPLGGIAFIAVLLLGGASRAQEPDPGPDPTENPPQPAAPSGTLYAIDALFDPDALRIEGVVSFTLRNDSEQALESIYLFTYPNHYSRLHPKMNDELWDRVYPNGLSVGDLLIDRVRLGGEEVRFVFPLRRDLGPRTLLRVDLPVPLAAGGAADM